MNEFTPLELFLYLDVFGLGVLITIAVQHGYTHFWGNQNSTDSSEEPVSLPKAERKRILNESRDNFEEVLSSSADRLQHELKATADRLNLHLEELGSKIIDKEMNRYREELDQLQKQADAVIGDVTSETKEHKDELKEKLNQMHEQASAAIENVTSELNNYRDMHKEELDTLHEQADKVINETGSQITEYKDELKDKLDQLHKQADTTIMDVTKDITEYRDKLKQQLSEEVAAEKQKLIEQVETKLSDAVASFLLESLRHNVDLGSQSSYLTSVLEEHKDELAQEIADEATTAT